MTSALRVAVSLGVAMSVLPVRVDAQQAAPGVRTMTEDAVRRAVAATAWPAVTRTTTPRSASDDAWSRLRDIEGEEIALTIKGLPAGKRYVVANSVNDSGLTVLNLTDPRIPAEAKDVLAEAAWWHWECFMRPLPAGGVRLNRHVRIEADSVFLDGNNVIGLAEIVEQIARTRVAEISYVHRATKRGLVWGVLSGAAAGVAIVTAQCGIHWNTETPSCPNLTGAWLFFAPGFGAGIGAAYGSGIKISTLVYEAPRGS